MNTKILNESDRIIKLEILGEGHTFCSILQQELLRNKKVEIAGYDRPHPLIDRSILTIRTTGTISPRKVLKEALLNLKKRLDEFSKEFER